MSNLIPFNFDDSLVRSALVDGQPWFVAKDICNVLEHSNSRMAVADNCREAGVSSAYIRSGGQNRSATIIDQGNVLRLITRSRLPAAERFESWLFDEMLPELLNKGSYSLVDQAEKQRLDDVKTGLRLRNEVERLINKIRCEHRPEVRATLYSSLVASAEAAGLPVPPLEALNTPKLAEQSRIDAFWNVVSDLIAKGEELNHSRDPARLAISLPHLERLAAKHGIKLPKRTLMHRSLRASETPLFIDYRTVHSALFGGAVKCWVFAQESPDMPTEPPEVWDLTHALPNHQDQES